MTTDALLEAALQLKGTGWHVVSSSFAGTPARMEIALEHDYVDLRCPACGAQCPGYDAVEKRWRHLNFFQYRCEMVAKDKAHADKDWSKVKAIAIDETSAKRGRSYVTVVMDMDTHAVQRYDPILSPLQHQAVAEMDGVGNQTNPPARLFHTRWRIKTGLLRLTSCQSGIT